MPAFVLAFLGLLNSTPIPVRLPADVVDAYALRANPGGLSFLRASELRLLYGRDVPSGGVLRGEGTDGLALFGAASLFDLATVAGAFEFDVAPGGNTSNRTSIGFGFGSKRAGLGLALEHVSPFSGAAKNILTTGLEFRLWNFLSVGANIRDLAQRVSPRLYEIGVALRPIGERVTLSTRWRLTQGIPVDSRNLDLALHLVVEPIEGIFIGVGGNYLRRTQSEFGVSANLAVAFDAFGVYGGLEDSTKSVALTSELSLRSRGVPSLLAGKRVALIDLSGSLVPDPSFSLLARGFETTPYGTAPLRLDALSRSERTIGAYVHISSLSIGWAKAEEIRSALSKLRNSGRRVDCELDASGDLEYFIASACNTIIMAPMATLELNGVASNVLFFGDALDKLGVKVEAFARGKYKSAPEQFTRNGMSEAQQESLSAYLDTVYGRLIDAITEGRNLNKEEVERALARGTLSSTDAVALKLVDAALYPDEVDDHVNQLYGFPVRYASAATIEPPSRDSWGRRPRIAVVHVDGTISGGRSRNTPIGFGESSGSETLVGTLDAVRQDASILAVVLRVDSPGGDVLASDLIARAVRQLDEVKPVIVSFGDVAASGGYYVAAGARLIYAEPTTLTGSIGVFSMKVSVAGLAERLGVKSESIERGPLSNAGSIFSEISDEERRVMEDQVDGAYRQFLAIVARGRKKSVEQVREIAEGRIWSGADAKRIGLVDESGGLIEAIARARKEARVPPETLVDIIALPIAQESLPVSFAKAVGFEASNDFAPWVRLVPQAIRGAIGTVVAREIDGNGRRPLALLPFMLDID